MKGFAFLIIFRSLSPTADCLLALHLLLKSPFDRHFLWFNFEFFTFNLNWYVRALAIQGRSKGDSKKIQRRSPTRTIGRESIVGNCGIFAGDRSLASWPCTHGLTDSLHNGQSPCSGHWKLWNYLNIFHLNWLDRQDYNVRVCITLCGLCSHVAFKFEPGGSSCGELLVSHQRLVDSTMTRTRLTESGGL